ncbi:primosomal protein N' [Bengtsoniella intestinalis]|uniref:replication restart helicase PriA n=1 Tax=Bengtsoniella intestinalis TaxID=3073143 RepID=UPI00391F9B63
METVDIVKVAVETAPYAIDKVYDYLLPETLCDQVVVGMRVMVPFGRGNRKSEALVLARTTGEKTPKMKAILQVLDEAPVLDGKGISLALWMHQRYFTTVYQAAKTQLPAGLWYRMEEVYQVAPEVEDLEALTLPEPAIALLKVMKKEGRLSCQAVCARCGADGEGYLPLLVEKKLVVKATQAHRKHRDKTQKVVSLAMDDESAMALVAGKKRSAPMRFAVVEFLIAAGRSAITDVTYFTGASLATVKGLEKSGIVTLSQEEVLRVPEVTASVQGAPIALNEEQQHSFDQLLVLTQKEEPQVALLQGVTGSGKTQVYIRLVQAVLAQGKQAMMLVPEIVLTPQMMGKFASYFGNRVAMLHSGLRTTERYDQWKRIRRGEVDVVLGTRSAVFAPLERLGLVILDEEQEGSYQSDSAPRYHARDIAKYRCTQYGATLVLGSATPLVETAYAAQQGQYHHYYLTQRYNQKPLPEVLFADMRQELRNGNSGAISGLLRTELEKNIQAGEQSILFLNRRGSSRMLLCVECGQSPQCPHCSVALVHHTANGRMMCHHCGYSEKASMYCPDCHGMMKQVGYGTQKVEEELQALFPDVEVLRMDADTTATGHEKILKQFGDEKTPILLGTQMVAKGLDFANVTLVGVLSADLSLYVDHYRATERTFHLLTQVVGRAGRGELTGRGIIQTFTPENDVMIHAAHQDYQGFYQTELTLRQLRRSPPFADIFTFTVSGGEEGAVLKGACTVRDTLKQVLSHPELEGIAPQVLGPAPAPILKVNNRYRYRVTLVAKNVTPIRQRISWLLREFPSTHRGLNLFVDCNNMS